MESVAALKSDALRGNLFAAVCSELLNGQRGLVGEGGWRWAEVGRGGQVKL